VNQIRCPEWAFALVLALVLLAVAAPSVSAAGGRRGGGGGVAPGPGPRTGRPRPGRGPVTLTVGRPAAVQPIAPGFLGLSLEYWAIPAYAGTNPRAIDPVFVQLIRNLAGGNPPVLRIGGDTTDDTWWPVAGASQPPGVTYTLSPNWAAITRSLASELRARLILGINLEADSAAVAATEAGQLVSGIGRDRIEALELGNEPELYGIFTWGPSGATGRPAPYDFPSFDQDFSRIGAALPNMPLAGPTVGAPGWFGYLGTFLTDQPRVTVATLHRYPLQLCYVRRGQPNYPTIRHLFTSWSTRRLASSVATAVTVAHAHHVPLRIDEMNTISCGDVPSVAQSFASALWALDTLFQMASVGVDGVNVHTFPGTDYELFTFRQVRGRWRGVVEPEYYGLDLFAQAAPAGSRLLSVSSSGGPGLRAWATLARDRTIRVVVINVGRRARVVAVRGATSRETGTLERLQARGLSARAGVTLAGQDFGASTSTGRLAGRRRVGVVAPRAGGYTFRVPAGSAALLTLAPR
jgi:hypothetical protein